MSSINFAQLFLMSKDVVKKSSAAYISKVKLYFKFKPHPTQNKSGIQYPGVEIFVCTVGGDGKPQVFKNRNYQRARQEYINIIASSDASVATEFEFSNPILVETGKKYGIAIKFDGNEDYVLWLSKTGDPLIDTGNPSPGSSDDFAKELFELVVTEDEDDEASNTGDSDDIIMSTSSTQEIGGTWRPLPGTFLKFDLAVSRFFEQGIPVAVNYPRDELKGNSINYAVSNTSSPKVTFPIPFRNMEYFLYDVSESVVNPLGFGGSFVYQNTVAHPGNYANGSATISISVTANSANITANTRYPNGQLFSWSSLYTAGAHPEYIIIKSASHANSIDKYVVRAVTAIHSNTVLQVSEPIPFSNSTAVFMKSAVAKIHQVSGTKLFGQQDGLITLIDSNSNGSIRFTSNSVESIEIVAGGSGYSNSDILYVNGFENIDNQFEGGYAAVGNLVTNSTGGITSLYLSNIGAHIIESNVSIVIANSTSGNVTSNTSAGSSANLAVTIGSVLKGEFFNQNHYMKDCRFFNQPVSFVNPSVRIVELPGTTAKMFHQKLFDRAATSNLVDGYYDRAIRPVNLTRDRVQSEIGSVFDFSSNVVNPTRSHLYSMSYTNSEPYVPVNREDINVNNALLVIETSSNNDFTCAQIVGKPSLQYGTYIINDDYTDEHTDRGNAWSKYISKRVKFQEDRFAEDMIVYLTAHRPTNTDIQVYARMYNSIDTEDDFNDKDWTRLELTDGVGLFSNPKKFGDLKELTYTLPQSPNTDLNLAGTVTVANDNVTVVGVGTAFNTDLEAGDLVKIYQPLFPDSHFISVVNAVTNSTQIVLEEATSNNDVLGSGMKVERIRTYKHQAFRNYMNQNVVRYYSENMVPFDTYDSYAIKIVLLSDSQAKVPSVDDMRAVGVSA